MKRPLALLLVVLLAAGAAFGATGRTSVANRVAVTGLSWTPANLTNLYDDWRSDSGVNVGATSVWTGRVNGLVLSQATGSLRPTVAAGELNGFSALSFDGVDDFISLASYAHAQPYGFLLVYKITLQSAASNHDFVLNFAAVVSGKYFLEDSTPRSFLSAGTNLAAAPQMAPGNARYTCAIFYLNSTSSWFAENGSTLNFGDASTSATTLLSLSAASDGTHSTTTKVVELVGFGALVAGETDQLFNYCRQTYANGLGI